MPSPSSPLALAPQHATPPPARSAQVCHSPAAIWMTGLSWQVESEQSTPGLQGALQAPQWCASVERWKSSSAEPSPSSSTPLQSSGTDTAPRYAGSRVTSTSAEMHAPSGPQVSPTTHAARPRQSALRRMCSKRLTPCSKRVCTRRVTVPLEAPVLELPVTSMSTGPSTAVAATSPSVRGAPSYGTVTVCSAAEGPLTTMVIVSSTVGAESVSTTSTSSVGISPTHATSIHEPQRATSAALKNRLIGRSRRRAGCSR